MAVTLGPWCNGEMTNTPDKIVYSVISDNTGGRGGEAVTTDPSLTLQMRAPVEMGGPGGGANPEQLFAMGYGACFQGALGLAAKGTDVDISESKVRVTVGIGPEGESFAIAVVIEVAIPGLKLDQVQQLADRTHELCPYSKATRGNVPVRVSAVESL